tara:strand:- start:2955 stop:3869 length:915 start_codon:yes stop_codon:yes gene_type:complete
MLTVRDFVGYGETPPDPMWPNRAKLAINFVINYEEGSEPSIEDGDGYSETWFTEAYGVDSGIEGRDLAAESLFEYGSRVGFWRLIRIFQERNLPLTIFSCALALERNESVAKLIRNSDYDICAHGLRWEPHYKLSKEEERERIRLAIESIKKTIGERPYGWYCRYSPSVNTRDLLSDEGGFLYDSDYYGDELPFWKLINGTQHLIIPYSLTNNDAQFAKTIATATQWFEFMRDAFDMLYREGSSQPKMMSVGLHPRMIGHPGRAVGLEMFLDHVMKHSDVWVTRRIDIANHWIKNHPFNMQETL